MQYPDIGSSSPEAIEFGRIVTRRGIENKLRYDGDRHALVFGGTGSGKSTRLVIPLLLGMRGNRSLLVTDPSGELAAISAPYRREVGDVFILNPFGVLADYQGYEYMEGCGFNPLCALDPTSDSFNADASILASALITVDTKSHAKHFDESAEALVTAIIMFVVIIARQHRLIPTMGEVRRLICMASEAPHPGNSFREPSEGAGIPKMAMQMMRSSLAALRNKAAQFVDWNREIQSVASTARTQTKFLDDPEIVENLARNDLDFSVLKRRPTTVFLVLPPKMMERHGKWMRLVLSAALNASMHPRQAGDQRVLFLLEEFAGLGHLEIATTAFAQARKYGVQLMPVFQDLPQLKDLYKDKWETFIGNAGVIASFAPNDQTTAEWLSKRMGQRTVQMTTVSENSGYNRGSNRGMSTSWGNNTGVSGNNVSQGTSGGGGDSTGESEGWSQTSNSSTAPVKVPVMLPQELYGLQPGYMVVISAGLSNAVPAFAPDYRQITSRANRARANPYYTNIPLNGRRRRSAAEPTWDWGQQDSDADYPPPPASPWDAANWPRGLPEPARKRTAPAEPSHVDRHVQARHPGYAPATPKRLPNENPASRHPGYAPD